MPARLALSFAQSGAHVSGVFPGGGPLSSVSCLQRALRYSAMFPIDSLGKAIEATEPDLIVPCDDRVVEHLHELYARSKTSRPSEKICSAIERSLGEPARYSFTVNRSKLLHLAGQIGIRVPETRAIRAPDELRGWLKEHGLPAVLKLDGTWGGSGVRIVHSWQEAEEAFHDLTRSLTLSSFLNHVSFHDFYPLFTSISNRDRDVTVQAYLEGSPANAMFACWEGKILDALSVEALYSQEKLGASTVVRTISNFKMEQAGRLLAEQLHMTGFFGLDFILDPVSKTPWLIELNPRATQIGHLEPTGGKSLVRTLCHQLTGSQAPRSEPIGEETIAFFPQFLQCDPETPVLAQANIRYDVPWQDPRLTRELMRTPWNCRHISAWLYSAALKAYRSSMANSLRRTTRNFLPKDRRM